MPRSPITAQLSIVLVCLVMTLFGANARAESQFWVSVGSFQKQESADRALAMAGEKLTERFSVIGTSTDNGYFYRVAAGPYLTRELADDMVVTARNAGFSGAWLWAEDSGLVDFYSPEASVEESDYLPLPEDDALLFDPSDYPDATLPGEGYERSREEIPQLIEEAPADYKLNKLRRDARIEQQARPPPDEPADSPSQLVLDLNVGSPISLPRFAESQINMTIDGNLNESVWSEFNGVDDFRVVDPDTLETPRHETVVKMFYTEAGLYAAFEMKQPPETLVRRYSGRDQGRINRDNVGVTLDTSGEGRYGYWLNLALGGNQVDGTVLPERQFSSDWDGAWYGGTAVTATGWDAEFFLPWSQVAMPKEEGERRFNAYVSRKVAYLDERYGLPGLPFTQPLFMSALQPLTLDQVDPRQQWSVIPYASVTQDEVEDYTDMKLGADIFWRPSSNFQVTGTINPDFGNVESDDVIVNLTAFETFFPEKRLFFQEGTEIFDATPRATGWRGSPTTVLNTRRIGGRPRAPDVPDDVTVPARELNQPTELTGALKVVGQFGGFRYGVLGATENETKFDAGELNFHQDGSDYGVARLIYEHKGSDGSYSALGGMSTYATHPDEDASVNAVDYHYLTADGSWKVDGQFLQSDVDDLGTGYGGFVDVSRTFRKGLTASLGLSHYDDKLNINTMGFLRRNDATNATLNVDYRRSDIDWARQFSAYSFAEFEVNGDGDHTRRGIGSRMSVDLHNRDRVKLSLSYFPERDEDRNSRGNGTYVVQGRHSASFEYATDSSQRFSYKAGVGHNGEEQGGHFVKGFVGVTWRPVDRINIGATADYRHRDGWLVWQEGRNLTTFESREWRPRLNLDYFLTAKQQLRLSAQWVGIRAEEQEFYLVPDRVGDLMEVEKPPGPSDDFALSRVNLQLRYRWEIAPLSELFVVYTLNGAETVADAAFDDLFNDALSDPQGEQLIVKLRYRLGS